MENFPNTVSSDNSQSSPNVSVPIAINAGQNSNAFAADISQEEAEPALLNRYGLKVPKVCLVRCNTRTLSSPLRKRNDQNEPSDDVYKCPVCLEIVRHREPLTTKCGHVFCRQCIETAIRSFHKCPMCKKKQGIRDTRRIYL